MTNTQVADFLRSIRDLLQILGESSFVALAYQNAARTIDGLEQDIGEVAARDGLEELPRIGKEIALKIRTFLETGSLPYYEELAAQAPAGVVAMLQVPDVGPKTVRRLWLELDITSVDQLKAAASEGRLRRMKGFGAKTEERILKGIELLDRRSDDRTPIGGALPLARDLVRGLETGLETGALDRVEIAGSLRRWRETTGEIRLLASCREPARARRLFQDLPQVVSLEETDAGAAAAILVDGTRAALHLTDEESWGAALCLTTGSAAHCAALQALAERQGSKLDERGLLATDASPEDGRAGRRSFPSEEALYRALGLQWIPPELREGDGELQAAAAGDLPVLVTLDCIRGEVHGHTTWSDGKGTVAEMAEAARARGLAYWALTDHSVGLGVTQGVDAAALAAQRREMDEANDRYAGEGVDFRLIQGTEVEVLGDGQLGLPDDLLASLDLVVASIHSGLRQERARITDRCLKAISNPYVDVIGHPSGRLLGRRPPSEIDMGQIMRACAETGTALEINANPARLDLSAAHVRRAVELGCKIVINTDAHRAGHLDLMPYGIHTARRGWLRAADVLNCEPLDVLLGSLKRNGSGRCQ